ncbi:hypothetical protein LX36DRAFT_705753 [Colletotrichum falcatum]|nr:hypothetical protein LX36DRAFT_705753 [Colletotrichum falcatum]
MAEHHPLPALPPQHQQPNQQLYNDQAADSYDEPAHFPPYQHQYDEPRPVGPSIRAQPQSQGSAQKQRQSPHRRARTFSFQSHKSHKSHRSSGSHNKIDLHESHQEKEAKRLHSKADPTVAMSEAEPSAVQAMTKTSLAPLRAIQHRDTTGNPITEPDRSNPTRSRWERPLDTIRSFEAAIDGGYRDRDRRQSYRSDAESVATRNRRSSYYATSGPRYHHDSYYGGRPNSFRPESGQFEMASNRQSYYDPYHNGGGGHHNGNIPYRQRVPRTQADPHMNGYGRGDQNIYPLPNKDRSYETVTSAVGSGSSAEHAGYHTDPTSSDNSSIERPSASKPQPVNNHGIGFAQGQSYQPSAYNLESGAPNGVQNDKGHAHSSVKQGPQISDKGANVLRRPVAAPPQQQQQQPQQRHEAPVKRKSWFSRRFSKAP